MNPLQEEVRRGLARAHLLCNPVGWLVIWIFAAFHTMRLQGSQADVLAVLVIIGSGLIRCRSPLQRLAHSLNSQAEPHQTLTGLLELELELVRRLCWTLLLASTMLLVVVVRRSVG